MRFIIFFCIDLCIGVSSSEYCIATLSKQYPDKLIHNLQAQSWYFKYSHHVFATSDLKKKNFWDMRPYFKHHMNRIWKKNSICNHTGSRHKIGYRTMCHFWYVDFIRFLSNCSFVLRLDSDIRLLSNQADPFLKLSKTLSPVEWQTKMDKKNVTFGMINLFQTICVHLNSWHSPYTNVMMINMSWVRLRKVQSIIRMVNKTNCIFYNRWGDLPLWGATLRILNAEKEHLNLSYYHKSHYNRLVSPHVLGS